MAADDQSEIRFLILNGTLPWQPSVVGFGAWVSPDAVGQWRSRVGQRRALPYI